MPRLSGLKGALPTVYDSQWQYYTDLSPEQIAAFQKFPEDLIKYASQRRWLAEISGTSVDINGTAIHFATDDRGKSLLLGFDSIENIQFKDALSGKFYELDAAGIKTIREGALSFIQQLFAAEAQILEGIGTTIIRSREQIDVLYAKIAPQSPSALGAG